MRDRTVYFMKFSMVLLGVLVESPMNAGEEQLDSLMLNRPELPVPKIVWTYPGKLAELWIDALNRPEVDIRCQTALTIAKAHERGVKGLQSTIPSLTKELNREGQHPAVLLACARALITLDAKESSSALFKSIATGDIDLREVIEPALARWAYAPAKELWLERINKKIEKQRELTLSISCLATAQESKAIPRLKELVLSPELNGLFRCEAAKSLGSLQSTGLEKDADLLITDLSPQGLIPRLCAAWILRRHDGPETVKRLQTLARDTSSSVVYVVISRLIEIDPSHLEALLTTILASNDANVRGVGIDALYRRANGQHIQLLGDRLSDLDPALRLKSRKYLLELAPKFSNEVIKAGEKSLNSSDWRGKEQAIILLAKLNHQIASTRFVELLNDDRPEVAETAAWGLRVLSVPATYPLALEFLKKQLPQNNIPNWRDRQLSHLIHLFGIANYEPAEPLLRKIVPPKDTSKINIRAAACWSLGLLHQHKPDPALDQLFSGRLDAVTPFDIEEELVRRMSGVALGWMKSKSELPTLQKYYASKKPSSDLVNNACGWAIEQITGEKVPAPEIVESPQRRWFLAPLD